MNRLFFRRGTEMEEDMDFSRYVDRQEWTLTEEEDRGRDSVRPRTITVSRSRVAGVGVSRSGIASVEVSRSSIAGSEQRLSGGTFRVGRAEGLVELDTSDVGGVSGRGVAYVSGAIGGVANVGVESVLSRSALNTVDFGDVATNIDVQSRDAIDDGGRASSTNVHITRADNVYSSRRQGLSENSVQSQRTVSSGTVESERHNSTVLDLQLGTDRKVKAVEVAGAGIGETSRKEWSYQSVERGDGGEREVFDLSTEESFVPSMVEAFVDHVEDTICEYREECFLGIRELQAIPGSRRASFLTIGIDSDIMGGGKRNVEGVLEEEEAEESGGGLTPDDINKGIQKFVSTMYGNITYSDSNYYEGGDEEEEDGDKTILYYGDGSELQQTNISALVVERSGVFDVNRSVRHRSEASLITGADVMGAGASSGIVPGDNVIDICSPGEDAEEPVYRKLERSVSAPSNELMSGRSSVGRELTTTEVVTQSGETGERREEHWQTSYLSVDVGGVPRAEEREEKEGSVLSELNVVWGKTIDADEEVGSSRGSELSYRSEIEIGVSRSHNTSFDTSAVHGADDSASFTGDISDFVNMSDSESSSWMDRSGTTMTMSDVDPLSPRSAVGGGGGQDTSGYRTDSSFGPLVVSDQEQDGGQTTLTENMFGVSSATSAWVDSEQLHRYRDTDIQSGVVMNVHSTHQGKQSVDSKSLGGAVSVEHGSKDTRSKKALFKVSEEIARFGRGPDDSRDISVDPNVVPGETGAATELPGGGEVVFRREITRVDDSDYDADNDEGDVRDRRWKAKTTSRNDKRGSESEESRDVRTSKIDYAGKEIRDEGAVVDVGERYGGVRFDSTQGNIIRVEEAVVNVGERYGDVRFVPSQGRTVRVEEGSLQQMLTPKNSEGEHIVTSVNVIYLENNIMESSDDDANDTTVVATDLDNTLQTEESDLVIRSEENTQGDLDYSSSSVDFVTRSLIGGGTDESSLHLAGSSVDHGYVGDSAQVQMSMYSDVHVRNAPSSEQSMVEVNTYPDSIALSSEQSGLRLSDDVGNVVEEVDVQEVGSEESVEQAVLAEGSSVDELAYVNTKSSDVDDDDQVVMFTSRWEVHDVVKTEEEDGEGEKTVDEQEKDIVQTEGEREIINVGPERTAEEMEREQVVSEESREKLDEEGGAWAIQENAKREGTKEQMETSAHDEERNAPEGLSGTNSEAALSVRYVDVSSVTDETGTALGSSMSVETSGITKGAEYSEGLSKPVDVEPTEDLNDGFVPVKNKKKKKGKKKKGKSGAQHTGVEDSGDGVDITHQDVTAITSSGQDDVTSGVDTQNLTNISFVERSEEYLQLSDSEAQRPTFRLQAPTMKQSTVQMDVEESKTIQVPDISARPSITEEHSAATAVGVKADENVSVEDEGFTPVKSKKKKAKKKKKGKKGQNTEGEDGESENLTSSDVNKDIEAEEGREINVEEGVMEESRGQEKKDVELSVTDTFSADLKEVDDVDGESNLEGPAFATDRVEDRALEEGDGVVVEKEFFAPASVESADKQELIFSKESTEAEDQGEFFRQEDFDDDSGQNLAHHEDVSWEEEVAPDMDASAAYTDVQGQTEGDVSSPGSDYMSLLLAAEKEAARKAATKERASRESWGLVVEEIKDIFGLRDDEEDESDIFEENDDEQEQNVEAREEDGESDGFVEHVEDEKEQEYEDEEGRQENEEDEEGVAAGVTDIETEESYSGSMHVAEEQCDTDIMLSSDLRASEDNAQTVGPGSEELSSNDQQISKELQKVDQRESRVRFTRGQRQSGSLGPSFGVEPSQRRILKPFRRFTKAPPESDAKQLEYSADNRENAGDFGEDLSGYGEFNEAVRIVESVLDSPEDSEHEGITEENANEEESEADTEKRGQKRKRIGGSQLMTTFSGTEWSEHSAPEDLDCSLDMSLEDAANALGAGEGVEVDVSEQEVTSGEGEEVASHDSVDRRRTISEEMSLFLLESDSEDERDDAASAGGERREHRSEADNTSTFLDTNVYDVTDVRYHEGDWDDSHASLVSSLIGTRDDEAKSNQGENTLVEDETKPDEDSADQDEDEGTSVDVDGNADSVDSVTEVSPVVQGTEIERREEFLGEQVLSTVRFQRPLPVSNPGQATDAFSTNVDVQEIVFSHTSDPDKTDNSGTVRSEEKDALKKSESLENVKAQGENSEVSVESPEDFGEDQEIDQVTAEDVEVDKIVSGKEVEGDDAVESGGSAFVSDTRMEISSVKETELEERFAEEAEVPEEGQDSAADECVFEDSTADFEKTTTDVSVAEIVREKEADTEPQKTQRRGDELNLETEVEGKGEEVREENVTIVAGATAGGDDDDDPGSKKKGKKKRKKRDKKKKKGELRDEKAEEMADTAPSADSEKVERTSPQKVEDDLETVSWDGTGKEDTVIRSGREKTDELYTEEGQTPIDQTEWSSLEELGETGTAEIQRVIGEKVEEFFSIGKESSKATEAETTTSTLDSFSAVIKADKAEGYSGLDIVGGPSVLEEGGARVVYATEEEEGEDQRGERGDNEDDTEEKDFEMIVDRTILRSHSTDDEPFEQGGLRRVSSQEDIRDVHSDVRFGVDILSHNMSGVALVGSEENLLYEHRERGIPDPEDVHGAQKEDFVGDEVVSEEDKTLIGMQSDEEVSDVTASEIQRTSSQEDIRDVQSERATDINVFSHSDGSGVALIDDGRGLYLVGESERDVISSSQEDLNDVQSEDTSSVVLTSTTDSTDLSVTSSAKERVDLEESVLERVSSQEDIRDFVQEHTSDLIVTSHADDGMSTLVGEDRESVRVEESERQRMSSQEDIRDIQSEEGSSGVNVVTYTDGDGVALVDAAKQLIHVDRSVVERRSSQDDSDNQSENSSNVDTKSLEDTVCVSDAQEDVVSVEDVTQDVTAEAKSESEDVGGKKDELPVDLEEGAVEAPVAVYAESFVDRHEDTIDTPVRQIIFRRLLEDVVSNRARAEEVVAQHPEASGDVQSSSLPGQSTLTQAGHLMSEMALLETTATEQRESLRLAVSEQEKYEQELSQLNSAISEAQQQLLASPVTASSVGALKQQMAERNVRPWPG